MLQNNMPFLETETERERKRTERKENLQNPLHISIYIGVSKGTFTVVIQVDNTIINN